MHQISPIAIRLVAVLSMLYGSQGAGEDFPLPQHGSDMHLGM